MSLENEKWDFIDTFVHQAFFTEHQLRYQPLKILLVFYVKLLHKTTTSKSCGEVISHEFVSCTKEIHLLE